MRLLALRLGADPSKRGAVLEDLESTYKWLQDHHLDAEQYLHHDEPLWLNVDDPATDRWEWNSATQLVFNPEDEDDRVPVRKWLAEFKPLLTASGVREILRPTKPTIVLLSTEEKFSGIMTAAHDLRHDTKLTDVVFIGPGGDEHPAHRFFLATTSNHFRRLFCDISGGIETDPSASAGNPVRVIVGAYLTSEGDMRNYSSQAIRGVLGKHMGWKSHQSARSHLRHRLCVP